MEKQFITDCPIPRCGCWYHAEDGTLCERAQKALRETACPLQDEERCPKCSRDFATCRCY